MHSTAAGWEPCGNLMHQFELLPMLLGICCRICRVTVLQHFAGLFCRNGRGGANEAGKEGQVCTGLLYGGNGQPWTPNLRKRLAGGTTQLHACTGIGLFQLLLLITSRYYYCHRKYDNEPQGLAGT